MRLLKRFETSDCLTHIVEITRLKRDQLGYGMTVPGDDESLPCLYALEQLWQLSFGFECTDFRHGISRQIVAKSRLNQMHTLV